MEHQMAVPAATADAPQPHAKPNYMGVFGILALLTAVEVGVAFVGLSRALTILVLLALAVWKALLVALYYMHLRYEPRRLIYLVLAPLPLVALLILVVLTEF